MKRFPLSVCLGLLLLLVTAGIPVTASPTISGVSPSSGTIGRQVTVTIMGDGFDSRSSVVMVRCIQEYGTSGRIDGTTTSWSPNKITATFQLSGSTVVPGDYDVVVISQTGSGYSLRGFSVNGEAAIYTTSPIMITTTYTPVTPVGPYGTIYVESSPPGAAISLNGIDEGSAPVAIRYLWPGKYTVSAKLAGYQEYVSEIILSESKYSSVFCLLVPNNSGNGLYIMSTPAKADVYLDGIFRGVTPLMQSNLATGTHFMQVRLSGYDDWKSTVEVFKEGTRTISATLNRNDTVLTQGISVLSDPAGASIILDGRVMGTTPKILHNIAGGIHVLEIDHPGYSSWKSTINVPETEIKDIAINLTPKTSPPGWIWVSSSPENASVTLDGRYVGRTPANSSLNLETVPSGEHIIALQLAGYQPFFTHTNVSPRLVSSVNAVLISDSSAIAKGTLSVISDPAGAEVDVDNESIGMSPLTKSDIAAGNHTVTIRMDGYQNYSASILITAGSNSSVSAGLLPVTYSTKAASLPLTVLMALGIFVFFVLREPE